MARRIDDPQWYARKTRDIRKGFLEMIVHCDNNIRNVYADPQFSDDVKDVLAEDMIIKKQGMIDLIVRSPNNGAYISYLKKYKLLPNNGNNGGNNGGKHGRKK